MLIMNSEEGRTVIDKTPAKLYLLIKKYIIYVLLIVSVMLLAVISFKTTTCCPSSGPMKHRMLGKHTL